jgi:signal transduction histidine kinase
VTIDGAVATIATIADITDRKRVEAAREHVAQAHQAARREAERANQMKDRFLATVSHELRTPLQAILAYTKLLTAGGLPVERRQAAVNAIERSAEAQARLVDSLLDIARMAAGKLELRIGPVDLNAVLLAAVDVVRPAAEAKGIALDVVTPQESVRTLGDSLRLQQVCWNLLSNAV